MIDSYKQEEVPMIPNKFVQVLKRSKTPLLIANEQSESKLSSNMMKMICRKRQRGNPQHRLAKNAKKRKRQQLKEILI